MPVSQSYWEDDISILSAENVNFAIETAGLGSRFAAVVIDMVLQMFVLGLVGIVGGVLADYLPALMEAGKWIRVVVYGLLIIFAFLILIGYYFFFEWLWDGQTPGKRWLGLRVLQANGMPVTMWQAMTRNVLRLVDFLPLSYGAGGIIALFNSHNRRIGDLVAGTVVARERRDEKQKQVLDINAAVKNFLETSRNAGLPPAAPAPVPAVGLATVDAPQTGEATAAAVAESAADAEVIAMMVRLDAEDYELTRDFLNRREKLPAVARARLAASLAGRLAVKLGAQLPAAADTERFLEEVASTMQRAGRD
jgi:uncharacterized RDD family membrane protein YckC